MNSQNISLGWALRMGTARMPLWKRGLDLALILILSPFLLVFGVAVSVLVKLGSPGPVLFRQQRIGYKGREFTCFKFRTMHVNSGQHSHEHHTRQLILNEQPMIKLDQYNDPRLV